MGMAVGNGASAGDDDDAGYRPMAEINITPMVDVMLVLLIIFMVAAPLMVAGVPLELPNTSAARVSQSKKAMVVSLDGTGALFIREEPVSGGNLVPRLRELRAAEGDTVVYVRADKKSNYGDVMDLLGRVGESGYGRVSLLSQPKPKGAE
jgi:biopolymer transport protein TolR